jgi:hypothetical protein
MENDLDRQLIEDTEKMVEQFKEDLIRLLISERQLTADSKTIAGLRVESNLSSMNVKLVGLDYIYYVIHGRGPGRFPPPNPLTGKFEIPFPVAKRIAEFGNKAEYQHVANAFDKLYDEFFEKVQKQAGKTALAYALKIGTLSKIG